ncbi:uncharacterized protein JCM6883_001995 [Sporobolomyces salmoneus]|uniref:uncharacterized protein n=1 Tax=Sporobolomyces salmoneus TaxID=183962 RepID=UPI00316DDCAE
MSSTGGDAEEQHSLGNKEKSQKLFSKVACAGCRTIKVRCRLPSGEIPTGSGGEVCTRCARLKIPCEYKSATRRGRKPKALVREEQLALRERQSSQSGDQVDQLMDPHRRGEMTYNSDASSTSASTNRISEQGFYPSPIASTSRLPGSAPPPPLNYLHAPIPQSHHYSSINSPVLPLPPTFPSASPYTAPRPLGPPPPPTNPSSIQSGLSPSLGPPARPPSNASSQTSSFNQTASHAMMSPASQSSPSRLYQSTAGSLVDAAATKASSFGVPNTLRPSQPPLPTHPDPIDLHVLSSLEAGHLFELWHSRLNCFIILLDRKLHTPEFVRKTSTVLFTSILAVSAKFFRPDLYQTLLLAAQQLVVRGTGEGTNVHIGLIQACLILIYWKQPTDSSAWIRTGFALRAAYQLGLHVKRTTPLPADEHEARLILDRERTWITLICFDISYQLSYSTSGVYETRMVSVHDVDIFAWLEETKPYGVSDDWEQGASILLLEVLNLLPAIAGAPTKVIASAVAGLVNEKLAEVYARYLDRNSPSHQELPDLAQHKIRFHFFSASVQVGKSCLVAAGVDDAIILSIFISRCGSLIDCFEDLTAGESPVFLMMQDNISIQLMGLGEMLGKLFSQVSPSVQATIVSYLTRIYTASRKHAEGDNIPAYVSRFFRAILRSIHPLGLRSSPPTRPGSPGTSSAIPPLLPAQVNPFEELGVVGEELLNPDVDTLVTSLRNDGTYWDSLFPGQSSWSWLDNALTDQSTGFTF